MKVRGSMKYKLSSNINISKTEDGSSIVLNSNDAQYYHFDKLTTDFLASLIKGVTLAKMSLSIIQWSYIRL